ncbi:MAG TPA: HAD-IC family P-type ATPase, partial [Phycisphaerae bacterium]|nr:HAD-IC family P-type ATPase [Phycisphaerae bacterium]
RGILVRDAAMLESMAHVSAVIWDKTGTLTVGWPDVQRVHTYNNRIEDDVLRLAAAVEQFSTHPIAKAIVAEARQRSIAITAAENAEVIPGSGASGSVEGYDVLVGSRRFLKERGIDAHSTDRAATGTEAFVAIDGALAGVIELADSLRPAAREAVARLKSMGVESELLTGDRQAAAESIARELAITSIAAEARPADKVACVRAARATGQRVAMVGDGINDAAALAEADVGIAFATGADIAAEAAGVNLIGHSPALVADAVQLARASLRVIRQNLWWAFIYNALMIPLAATGRLAPGLAAGAMMISSLTVVLNALRLSRVVGRR